MSKSLDLGNGFVMNKERGLLKDNKVIFNPDQLTALIIFYDYCKACRKEISSQMMNKIWNDFFKGESNES